MSITIDIYNDEASFIKACIQGEEWAMKMLYEEFYPLMLPVCLRYASNEHEALDILQEGFIKVFRYLDKYKPGTSLKSWIKRIMINTSIDFYRKRSKKRTEDIESAFSVSSSYSEALDHLKVEEIMKAVQQLSPSCRAVFNLYVIEGYSHREVGEILNITESTSRSNLVKARNKLKEMISRLGGYER